MSVHIAQHSDDGFIIIVFDRKTQNWIAVATTPNLNLAKQISVALQRSLT
jgi:hypothetical protein